MKPNSELLSEQPWVQAVKLLYVRQPLFSQIRVMGNNGMLGKMPMDEYYTELSELDRSKISQDTDLFVIEKEGHTIKKKKRVRSQIFTNYLSTGIDSEAIISNYNQSVVIGNPGVGKSTYARWLCHQWGKNELTSPFVLLYINLRELDLRTGAGGLLQYLSYHYFNSEEASVCRKTLHQHAPEIKYVLDGLDEIDQADKIMLVRQLEGLTPSGELPPYLLLSRPYGIRDTIFKQARFFHEIIGFNEAQRRHYVERVLAQAGIPTGKSASDLLARVDANSVLQDISFNPLMLSYLTVLYLDSSRKEDSIFERIESIYQLQELILNLLMEYHARDKGLDQQVYTDALARCRALSGELELNKRFIYEGNSARDDNRASALLLSQLGLGRYEDRAQAGSWQFYFNSITFQEFLAAEHFGPRVTSFTFLYLLGDLFFWNFSKMLLGYLSYHRLDNVLNGIFGLLEEKFEEKHLAYYVKLKYITLSELDAPIVQERMTQEAIAHMIDFAHFAWMDYLRRDLYADAVYKIYKKMTAAQQQYLREFIPYYLSYSIEMDSEEAHRIQIPESIVQIIKSLGLVDDPEIARCLLDYLILYQEKSAALWKEVEKEVNKQGEDYDFEGTSENWRLEQFDYAMMHLYELLKTARRSTLAALKPKLEYLCEAFPDSLNDQSTDLLMSLGDATAYYAQCLQLYHTAVAVFEQNLQSPPLEVYPDPGMTVLSRTSIGLARGAASLLQAERVPAYTLLRDMEMLFARYCDSAFATPEEIETIYTHFAEALKSTHEPDFYPSLFHLLAYYRIPELFEIQKPDAYVQFLERTLQQLEGAPEPLESFQVLLHAFETTTLGRLILYRYRDPLVNIYYNILQPHLHRLEKSIARKKPEQYLEIEDEPIPALLAQMLRAFHLPYDRKFLLEYYREKGLLYNGYFAKHHVPELLSEEFAFSESWIWAYVKQSLLSEKPIYLKLFAILYNEMLYAYPDNQAPIESLWMEIFKRDTEKEWQAYLKKYDSYVFLALYRHLRHYYVQKDRPINKSDEFIAALQERLLSPAWQKLFLSESNLHHLDMCQETMGLWSLFGWVTGDSRFKMPDQYHSLLLKRVDIYRKVALDWVDIAGSQWEKVSSYFPEATVEWFQKQYDMQQEVNYRLEADRFTALLRPAR